MSKTSDENLKAIHILTIVLREMRAFGQGWKCHYVDFEGRALRNQLDFLAEWAEESLLIDDFGDYHEGSDFYQDRFTMFDIEKLQSNGYLDPPKHHGPYFPTPWDSNLYPEKSEGWFIFQDYMRDDPKYYSFNKPPFTI